MPTFQEHAAENLRAFGWDIAPDDIPDDPSCAAVIVRIMDWHNKLDDLARKIINAGDPSDQMWEFGFFNEFPALYNVLNGNAFENFALTFNDAHAALVRAAHQVTEEQHGQTGEGLLGGTGVDDVLAAADG